MNKTLAVISLGCDKNRVDTERMLAYLSGGKYVITNEAEAQILIINTCAFIESARKEAIDTILHAITLKKQRLEKLIVTGCLAQKYMGELKKDLPEVDAFLGTNDYNNILDVINSLYNDAGQPQLRQDDIEFNGRILTTNPVYAYLKISDGCNNHCTFCTIPSIRGAYRSQSIDSLVKEASSLVAGGVKELVLVGQDVTRYGTDIYGKKSLVELINRLSETDIQRIRLMYCYPSEIDERLIDTIRDNPKVVKYIDMPVQHVNDDVLRLMGRSGDGTQIRDVINRLRLKIPSIALRTTFMVGFPGETEQAFEQLAEFVREVKPTHAGVFCYSPEADTPSYKLKNKVNAKEKHRRNRVLYDILRSNRVQENSRLIGQVLPVLYEGIDFNKNLFYGRAEFSAPDVDTLVYFKGKLAQLGHTYNVRILKSKGMDLLGKIEQ